MAIQYLPLQKPDDKFLPAMQLTLQAMEQKHQREMMKAREQREVDLLEYRKNVLASQLQGQKDALAFDKEKAKLTADYRGKMLEKEGKKGPAERSFLPGFEEEHPELVAWFKLYDAVPYIDVLDEKGERYKRVKDPVELSVARKMWRDAYPGLGDPEALIKGLGVEKPFNEEGPKDIIPEITKTREKVIMGEKLMRGEEPEIQWEAPLEVPPRVKLGEELFGKPQRLFPIEGGEGYGQQGMMRDILLGRPSPSPFSVGGVSPFKRQGY